MMGKAVEEKKNDVWARLKNLNAFDFVNSSLC